jgi:hypothetical protein
MAVAEADVVVRQRAAAGPQFAGPLRQAAGGQRDVRGDDVALPGLPGDPVVGRPEAGVDDQPDQLVGGHGSGTLATTATRIA